MSIITIVTPSYRPDREHLLAAYGSILQQKMPSGWAWRWAIQVDGGPAAAVTDILPADPRVSVGGGRRSGECSTRNLALARADGELVKVLDADDMLAPGTLARDIRVLAAEADVGWTTFSRARPAPRRVHRWFRPGPARRTTGVRVRASSLACAQLPGFSSPGDLVHSPRACLGTGRVDGAPGFR